jgi:hypothetical protein
LEARLALAHAIKQQCDLEFEASAAHLERAEQLLLDAKRRIQAAQ